MVCSTLYSPFGSTTLPTRIGFSKVILRASATPNLFWPACNNTVIPSTKMIATVRSFIARIVPPSRLSHQGRHLKPTAEKEPRRCACSRTTVIHNRHRRLLCRGPVNPKNFEHRRHFGEVVHGAFGGFIVSSKEIQIEHVFPRTPLQRPGFDLAQADIAQGKRAKRLEQCACLILQLKGTGGLVRSCFVSRNAV